MIPQLDPQRVRQVAQLVANAHDLVRLLRDITSTPRSGAARQEELALLESQLSDAYRAVIDGRVVPAEVITTDSIGELPGVLDPHGHGSPGLGLPPEDVAPTQLLATVPEIAKELVRAVPRLTIGPPAGLSDVDTAVRDAWLDQLQDLRDQEGGAAFATLTSPGRVLTAMTISTTEHATRRILDQIRTSYVADLMSASGLVVVITRTMCPSCTIELLRLLAAYPRLNATVRLWTEDKALTDALAGSDDDDHAAGTVVVVVSSDVAGTAAQTITHAEALATDRDTGVLHVATMVPPPAGAEAPEAGPAETTASPGTTGAPETAAWPERAAAPEAAAWLETPTERSGERADRPEAPASPPDLLVGPPVAHWPYHDVFVAPPQPAGEPAERGYEAPRSSGPTPVAPEPSATVDDERGHDSHRIDPRLDLDAPLTDSSSTSGLTMNPQPTTNPSPFTVSPGPAQEHAGALGQGTEGIDLDTLPLDTVDDEDIDLRELEPSVLDDDADQLFALLAHDQTTTPPTLDDGIEDIDLRELEPSVLDDDADQLFALLAHDQTTTPPTPTHGTEATDTLPPDALDDGIEDIDLRELEPSVLDDDADQLFALLASDQSTTGQVTSVPEATPTPPDVTPTPEVGPTPIASASSMPVSSISASMIESTRETEAPAWFAATDPTLPTPTPPTPTPPTPTPSTFTPPAPTPAAAPPAAPGKPGYPLPEPAVTGVTQYPRALDSPPAGPAAMPPVAGTPEAARLIKGVHEVVKFLSIFPAAADRAQAEHNNVTLQTLAARVDERYRGVPDSFIAELTDEQIDRLPATVDVPLVGTLADRSLADWEARLTRALLRGARLAVARERTPESQVTGRQLMSAVRRLRVAELAGPDVLGDNAVRTEWQALLQQAGGYHGAALATVTLASGENLTVMTTSDEASLVQAYLGGSRLPNQGRLPRYITHPAAANPIATAVSPPRHPDADAEKKIFDYLVTNHDERLDLINASYLTMVSTEGICPWCSLVALQFLTDYPGLGVTVRLWNQERAAPGMLQWLRWKGV